MPHKATNPATFTPPKDRHHFAIIVLLCVFVILGGAGVQAYRVHDAGWVPNATAQFIFIQGSGSYLEYTIEHKISLYRNSQGLLNVQNLRSNKDAFCFSISIIERQYQHPFRKVKMRPAFGLHPRIYGSSFHAYSTFRIKQIYASDATLNPVIHFVEDHPGIFSRSIGDVLREHSVEIQKPYPEEDLHVLDEFFLQEYAQYRTQGDPLYADFPIVRHDGIDPALPAILKTPSVLNHRAALPASTHRYTRNELGTPESPLILADWIDGAKTALIYVVAPIILLDLIGYWGIYRMTGIRRRKYRKMRGECIRCGYPLMDRLCCECGLRVDVETDDAAAA